MAVEAGDMGNEGNVICEEPMCQRSGAGLAVGMRGFAEGYDCKHRDTAPHLYGISMINQAVPLQILFFAR